MSDTLETKDDLELAKKKTVRNRTNSMTNSNSIEAMNNRVTDSIERGFQTHWVLETTAKHLAFRALETEDEKWLDMIHYLKTQKGDELPTADLRNRGPNSYGRTLKGKQIILDTMEKLRVKQNKREKSSISAYNLKKKQDTDRYKKEAFELLLKKSTTPPDEWDTLWSSLIVRAGGDALSSVVKGERDNFESLNKDFRTVTDAEAQDMARAYINKVPVDDIFDLNMTQEFMEMGVTLTEKQEGDLKDIITSLKDFDKIKEVTNFISDAESLIDDMVTAEKAYQYPDVVEWGVSAPLNQAIREQKRVIKEEVKNLYIKHLQDNRTENGSVVPYQSWTGDGKQNFLTELEEKLTTLIPKKNKAGQFEGELYNNLRDTFTDNPPPILKRDIQKQISTLNALRGTIEKRKGRGVKLSPDEENYLKYLNKQLYLLDPKGEEQRKKAQEDFRVLTETRLITAASPTDKPIRKELNTVMIKAATMDKESGGDLIDEFFADQGLRGGKRIQEKVARWKKNIVAPLDTQVSKDMSSWYKGKLASYFPGFLPGFLEGALRFDRERKLERVPSPAVDMVHNATKKARRLVESEMSKEVKKQKKPYGAWHPTVKNNFADRIERLMKEQVFTTEHMLTLRSMMPKQELDWSSQSLADELRSMNKSLEDLSLKDAELYYTAFIPNGTIKGSSTKDHIDRLKALADFIKQKPTKKKK